MQPETRNTLVKCDASRSGLGTALEMLRVDGWKPIAFTSRFLNSCEERHRVNELIAVVRSIEYFKNDLCGKHFMVITDHRAFLSLLEENRSNKSYNGRLIVDGSINRASQITAESEPVIKATNLISTMATREHKHNCYLSPAPRNQFTNTSCNSNKLKYAYTANTI